MTTTHWSNALNKFTALSVAASLAVSFVSLSTAAVAAERAGAPANKVSGEKVDSGLGELPHYSKWADPTGKNPVPAKAQAKRDEKPAQRLSVQVSQAK
jgi:hypothetical protein